jgi:hypothetical protein
MDNEKMRQRKREKTDWFEQQQQPSAATCSNYHNIPLTSSTPAMVEINDIH